MAYDISENDNGKSSGKLFKSHRFLKKGHCFDFKYIRIFGKIKISKQVYKQRCNQSNNFYFVFNLIP